MTETSANNDDDDVEDRHCDEKRCHRTKASFRPHIGPDPCPLALRDRVLLAFLIFLQFLRVLFLPRRRPSRRRSTICYLSL